MTSPLNEKHYRLAESFGVSRSQIHVFDSLDELKQSASSRGISDEEIEQYAEETSGLNIRDHAGSGVSACEIFIRQNGHLNGGLETYYRIENRGLQSSIRFMDNGGEFFYAFVLLHEIAHSQLNHDAARSPESYDHNEREADEWAYSRLMEAPEFSRAMTP
jgi:hypothetical protein